MHRAVSSGFCEPTSVSRKPGKMAHSRWLTTASRALRVYVSTEEHLTRHLTRLIVK